MSAPRVHVLVRDPTLEPDSPLGNAGNPAPEYNDIDGSWNDLGIEGGPYAVPGEMKMLAR